MIALVPPALYAVTNLLDVVLIRRVIGAVDVGALILFTGFSYVALFIVSWGALDFIFPAFSYSALWAMVAGVLWTAYLIPYYRSVALYDPAIAVAFFSLIPVFLAVFGWVMLEEAIHIPAVAGIVLVCLGVAGASVPSWVSIVRAPFGLWFRMALSSLIVTLGIISFKFSVDTGDFSYWYLQAYLALAAVGFVVLLFLLMPRYVGQVCAAFRRAPIQYISFNIANEVIDQAAGALLRYAQMLGPVALVQAINAGVQPFYVLFGWGALTLFGVFRKDTIGGVTVRKLIYLSIAATGVVLVYVTSVASNI